MNPTVPDLDKYEAVSVSEHHGCGGCVFRPMLEVKCSEIPCNPRWARPYPVIYKKKETHDSHSIME